MTIAIERDDIERGVEALSETYPKAFFVNGRLRRPLKLGIAKDIKADLAADPDSELKFYDIDQVLAHVGYQNACSVAGAVRVDLDGARPAPSPSRRPAKPKSGPPRSLLALSRESDPLLGPLPPIPGLKPRLRPRR